MSVSRALEIVTEFEEAVARVADEVKEKNEDYFASVAEKVAGIKETIERTNVATSNQMRALANIRDGVEKWIRDD